MKSYDLERLLDAMTRSPQRFWTRKDVARVLECSVDTVARNEKELGLARARKQINPRLIRYRTSIAIRALQKLKADLAPYPRGEPLPCAAQR